jgi:hypothetical protein
MKNFGFLFLFVILLVSCNSSNHVLPESSVFSNLGNSEISDNEVETYSKELGFKVSRLTEKGKPNSLNFKNKQDVKLFLKLVKYGDKNNEMNQILERNFKELTKNKDIKNLTRNEIKKSLDQVLSVTSLCQNWNSSHYGSAPLGFATLNFGINLTNGLPSNVSTWTSGWTLGVGWTTGWVEVPARSNDTVTITVHGTEDYSIFIDGIGTLFSTNVTYKIYIHCNGSLSIDRIYQ